VASLVPGVPLTPAGKVGVYKGSLPPRLVLGVDFSCDVSITRPGTQPDRLQKLRLTAFADFKVNDKLAFRLGVPVAADTVVRKADTTKNIAEQRGLQWTIPVYALAIIKI
jgi:hypothetical protein